MKYKVEDYVDCGLWEDCEDLSNYKAKLVKCKKEHTCTICEEEIKVGDYALSETGFLEGEPVSIHTCITCADKWLDELIGDEEVKE